MTEDELKKEAEESFEKYRVTDIDYVVSPYSEDEGEKKLMFNNEYDAEEEYFRLYSKGYLESAEPREKQIAELDCQKNRNKFCYSCANATERCFRNEIGCPCDKYKSYKDENAELKEKVSFLEDNLRVARKDREDLQLDVAKGLKEFVKDYPATALRYLANEKYVEQLTKAKEHIKQLLDCLKQDTNDPQTNYYVCKYMDKAEQFLKDSEAEK